jgi:hypothetical protein
MWNTFEDSMAVVEIMEKYERLTRPKNEHSLITKSILLALAALHQLTWAFTSQEKLIKCEIMETKFTVCFFIIIIARFLSRACLCLIDKTKYFCQIESAFISAGMAGQAG